MSDPTRWYPRAWRDRYGDELTALMRDTFGDRRVPLGTRLDLFRGGWVERLREVQLLGGGSTDADRARSGALLVLCGWALFVVAGAAFAKFIEQWDLVVPRGRRALPASALGAVTVGAVVGAVVVALATAAAAPELGRLLRRGGWRDVRRPITLALAMLGLLGLVTTALVLQAHHVSNGDRNGGSTTDEAVAIVWALLVVATIGACTGSVVVVAKQLELSDRVRQLERRLAFALTSAMLVIFVGTLTWWVAVAVRAPSLLTNGLFGVNGPEPAPPVLVGIGLLMVVGLALAADGVHRLTARRFELPVA